MTTERQVEANRRNARKSTGPRTDGGKAITRFNALRHGLLSQQVVIPGEDEQAFAQLQESILAEFWPEGALQGELVDQMLAALWRLRRLRKVEAGLFVQNFPLDDPVALVARSGEPQPEHLTAGLGLAFIRDSNNANAFSKLSRYETTILRSFYAALHELRRIQIERSTVTAEASAG